MAPVAALTLATRESGVDLETVHHLLPGLILR